MKLSEFLLQLVRDSAKLQQYVADPDAFIDASNLSDAHKRLLRSGNLGAIQQEVRKEQPGAVVMRIFAIS